MSKIFSIEHSSKPAEVAGRYINDILANHMDMPILLLLAGGSSMAVLDHINPEYLHEHITVTVTDERFTDDASENNFDILQSTSFYNNLVQVDAFCINTSVWEGDTPDTHAQRYEKNIKDWISEFPTGIIIGLYGMGADGHTGGIIPGVYAGDQFTNTYNSDDAYVAITKDNRIGTPFPIRITTTFSFMKRINYPLFYITGESKRSALEKAIMPSTSYEEIPARIVLDMNKPVIFTDIELG